MSSDTASTTNSTRQHSPYGAPVPTISVGDGLPASVDGIDELTAGTRYGCMLYQKQATSYGIKQQLRGMESAATTCMVWKSSRGMV